MRGIFIFFSNENARRLFLRTYYRYATGTNPGTPVVVALRAQNATGKSKPFSSTAAGAKHNGHGSKDENTQGKKKSE